MVSSIQANSSERQYAFASAESPVVVVISVPINWDEASPEWIKSRCELGLVCSGVNVSNISSTILLKRVVVDDVGRLCDLDWDEVRIKLAEKAALSSLLNDFAVASKAVPHSYSKVFNKKVLDKKTTSVV